MTQSVLHLAHSVQLKSSGLKFRTSRSGSDVTYSCHHNSSHFTFPIFMHSWCFSVFHSLQSITPHTYELKTPIHLLNLKLKHELNYINFPRHMAYGQPTLLPGMDKAVGVFLHVAGIAEPVKVGQQCCSEMSYVGSSPSIAIYTYIYIFFSFLFFSFFCFLYIFYTHQHSNCAIIHPLFNCALQKIFLLFFCNSFSLFTDILIQKVCVRLILKQGMCISLVLRGPSR